MNSKILIIDDDEEFVFILQKVLQNKSCTVYAAHTLADGLRLLQEHTPDRVYIDNVLPDGHGWEKVDYILTNYPHIQLNLISALDVPKTSTSSFRIVEKELLLEELSEAFPS